MNFFTFTKLGRTLLMMVVVIGAVCLSGCGNNSGGSGSKGNSSSGSDSFTDKRDAQKYRTVKIGGKTWMAQNLNYDTDNSWCYDNDNSNCNKFGRLYGWESANTVCPSGWYLPSEQDWDDLYKATGGKLSDGTLMSTVTVMVDGRWGENGTGFSAFPGGYRQNDGSFRDAGRRGIWWASSNNSLERTYIQMPFNNNGLDNENTRTAEGFSVRCAKE